MEGPLQSQTGVPVKRLQWMEAQRSRRPRPNLGYSTTTGREGEKERLHLNIEQKPYKKLNPVYPSCENMITTVVISTHKENAVLKEHHNLNMT